MRKVLLSVVIALCFLPLASACASQALVDMLVYDEEFITGVTLEALQLKDGVLLVGASEYLDGGWMAFLEQNGEKRWSLTAEPSDLFRCPSPLDSGGFSVLLKRCEESDGLGGCNESVLLRLDSNGEIVDETPLPQITEWLLTDADGYYAIGYLQDNVPEEDSERDTSQPSLLRLDGAGNTLWHLEYTNPDYSDMSFKKGAMVEDSIIIIGDAYNIKHQASVGLLNRVDLKGNVIWTNEAALGNDSYINDFCVTGDGLIAGIYTNITYDEEDGFPSERLCSVFLMNMDGKVLWEYALENGLMLDYILPVAGGFLCGSRGLDLENCPYIGDGWLLLLDLKGKVRAADSTPDIGGGKYELLGISKNIDGEALLCGTVLDEPGFPGAPFVARLNFPKAYQ